MIHYALFSRVTTSNKDCFQSVCNLWLLISENRHKNKKKYKLNFHLGEFQMDVSSENIQFSLLGTN